ncbi:MAG: GNAT family N-acetyltransferase [Lentimicrobium sp.]|jgi:GNAT superfamily N-acetyltransferase|nr:GNAT family N-acetyltransferase [Lentimicrobium sp.]
MRIEINHTCADYDSYRAERVKSLFNAETGYSWSHTAELPIDEMIWRLGLIVGPSGTGKTSIGKQMFPGVGIHDLYAGWPTNRPIVDAINPNGDFNAVTASLSAVGLGDVPAWLRPFNVLSNGEQFRAGLARLLCERHDIAIIDEFTSVIDRQIAKIGASAFARSWRRGSGKAVLLSCHYDIIDWLQPDWVYDTREARFYSRDCLRRPQIELSIYRVPGTKWKFFKPHYYLDLPHPVAAQYFIGFVGDEPVAHLAVCPLFQSGHYRATRLVVMPEWQGAGVGTAFLNEICRLHLEGHGRNGHKLPTLFHTSHPQLCQALRKSPLWEQVSGALKFANKAKSIKTLAASAEAKGEKKKSGGFGGHFRAVQGFRYVGGRDGH